jgi:hypothetical protein
VFGWRTVHDGFVVLRVLWLTLVKATNIMHIVPNKVLMEQEVSEIKINDHGACCNKLTDEVNGREVLLKKDWLTKYTIHVLCYSNGLTK